MSANEARRLSRTSCMHSTRNVRPSSGSGGGSMSTL
ncbi:Uncharacterised protein [Bordetella pertussis]|nr:Uncharacterised protein [Bordetella pertussis]